jgi:sugar phosphate permease
MILIYGIMGAVGALLFFTVVKSEPPTIPRETDEGETISTREGVRSIFKIRNFVILGFIALIGIGVFNGLATWIEKILVELHDIPMVDAGTISAVLVLGGMAGCVVIPIVSDKMKRRRPFLILASSIGTACMIGLMFKSSFTINMVNGIVLGFFLLSALPIMLTMSIEITGQKYAGISVAYLQLLGNGAAVAIVPVMELLNGMRNEHTPSLILLAALLFIAFILALRIKETGNQA